MPNNYRDLFIAKQDALELRKATALVYQPRLEEDGTYRLQINYSLSPYREFKPPAPIDRIAETSSVKPKVREVGEPTRPQVVEPPPPPGPPPVGIFAGKDNGTPTVGQAGPGATPLVAAAPIAVAPIAANSASGTAASGSLSVTGLSGAGGEATSSPSSSAITGLIVNAVVK
ncbi:MAG: hypothetical protein QM523_02970 [Candidatus Pacebacteria bacterium]|nr:hypothetical protein [Candidatus Paceibacterota bacterium]